MNKISSHAIALAAGGLLVAATCAYHTLSKPLPSVIAQPAKEIEKVVWKTKACPGIKVAPEATRKSLGVPDAVQGDVVAAVRIPGDEYPHVISGIYSPATMAVTLLDRRDRLPWLAFDLKRELGLAYGVKDSGTVTRAYAKADLIQIKSLRGGLTATLDSDGDWFAGVSLGIRF